MIELYKFVFSTPWVFLGTVTLIVVFAICVAAVIGAVKQK